MIRNWGICYFWTHLLSFARIQIQSISMTIGRHDELSWISGFGWFFDDIWLGLAQPVKRGKTRVKYFTGRFFKLKRFGLSVYEILVGQTVLKQVGFLAVHPIVSDNQFVSARILSVSLRNRFLPVRQHIRRWF